MKLITTIEIILFLIMALSLTGCFSSLKMHDRQEQAVLIAFQREANNKAVLHLKTLSGKSVIYYDKVRGIGKARWYNGDKYTVHFNESDKVIKITLNK